MKYKIGDIVIHNVFNFRMLILHVYESKFDFDYQVRIHTGQILDIKEFEIKNEE